MFSMSAQPKPPNLPQLFLDFIQSLSLAIKDPSTLQPMVDAAKAIADAGAVTDELRAAQEKALQDINDAAVAKQDLQDTVEAVAQGRKANSAKAQELLEREKRAEADRSELDRQFQALADQQRKLAQMQADVKAREDAVQGREDNADNRDSVLTTREQVVSRREQAFAAASKMVAGPQDE